MSEIPTISEPDTTAPDRLYESLKREARERDVLADVARIIGSSLDIEEVYEAFAQGVARLVPFDRIVVNLVDPDQSTLTTAYVWGRDNPNWEEGVAYPLAGSIEAEIARSKNGMLFQPQDLEKAVEQFPMERLAFESGIFSLVAAPLIHSDRVIGVLVIGSSERDRYSVKDLEILESVAFEIAAAVANAQLYSTLFAAEAKIRTSESRYRDLYENAPVGYYELDAEGVLTSVNTAFEQLLGCASDDLLGRHAWDFMKETEESRRSFQARMRGEPGADQGFQRTFVRKDGAEVPVLIESRLLKDIGNKITGLRIAVQDISEMKRLSAELELRAAELTRSNADLEQFAYVASHDLQEPLRMVSSYLELLARRYAGRLDSDADEFIGFAVDGAHRMQALVNDLLAYSRVGTRGGTVETVDLQTIVDRAQANLEVAVEESGATITCGDMPIMVVDSNQLARLFQNLIGNAIKFSGDKRPEIRVGAERGDGEWVFSVCDNGIGIEARHVDRIFGVFQRLHARTEYAGTGIGLAMCKKTVEWHGGRIWVESIPGAGSTFSFTIPEKNAP